MPKFLYLLAPDDGQAGGGDFDSSASEAITDVSDSSEGTPDIQTREEQIEHFLELEDESGKRHAFKTKDEFLKNYKNMMMLQSDYTRKRQAESEDRKKWEQERESTMKELMSQKERFDQYNKFLKENPHVMRQLEELKKKANTPEVAVLKAQAYADEKYGELQKKLEEMEKKERDREMSERKNKTLSSLKSRYNDFDHEQIEQEMSRIDPDNIEQLYELMYYALKGRMNPAELEKRFAQSAEEKKKARLIPGGSGGRQNSPDKSFNSLDEAVQSALSEM